jgi:hypothetical protein
VEINRGALESLTRARNRRPSFCLISATPPCISGFFAAFSHLLFLPFAARLELEVVPAKLRAWGLLVEFVPLIDVQVLNPIWHKQNGFVRTQET